MESSGLRENCEIISGGLKPERELFIGKICTEGFYHLWPRTGVGKRESRILKKIREFGKD